MNLLAKTNINHKNINVRRLHPKRFPNLIQNVKNLYSKKLFSLKKTVKFNHYNNTSMIYDVCKENTINIYFKNIVYNKLIIKL